MAEDRRGENGINRVVGRRAVEWSGILHPTRFPTRGWIVGVRGWSGRSRVGFLVPVPKPEPKPELEP